MERRNRGLQQRWLQGWIRVKQRTVKNAPIHGNTLQNWVRQYHQGVLAIDDSGGRLREALEKSGQLNNTLIVFAADQGIACGQKASSKRLFPTMLISAGH